MAGIPKSTGVNDTQGVVYEFATGRRRLMPSAPSEGHDSAGMTAAARELSHARTLAAAAPEIREARVRVLKAQIANGTYAPQPRDVARAILEHGL